MIEKGPPPRHACGQRRHTGFSFAVAIEVSPSAAHAPKSKYSFSVVIEVAQSAHASFTFLCPTRDFFFQLCVAILRFYSRLRLLCSTPFLLSGTHRCFAISLSSSKKRFLETLHTSETRTRDSKAISRVRYHCNLHILRKKSCRIQKYALPDLYVNVLELFLTYTSNFFRRTISGANVLFLLGFIRCSFAHCLTLSLCALRRQCAPSLSFNY